MSNAKVTTIEPIFTFALFVCSCVHSFISAARRSTRRRSVDSESRESLAGVAEAVDTDAHPVHHRQVQVAHLPLGSIEIIEHPPGPELPAAAADHDHREMIRLVI